MTLEEAFKIIDNICAQASLTRNAHITVQQALQVIKEATEKAAAEKPKKGKE